MLIIINLMNHISITHKDYLNLVNKKINFKKATLELKDSLEKFIKLRNKKINKPLFKSKKSRKSRK